MSLGTESREVTALQALPIFDTVFLGLRFAPAQADTSRAFSP